MKTSLSLLTITLTLFANHASAALFDRGNGLIYDDTLDITWLQNANYANTQGYSNSINGRMNWFTAKEWADELDFAGYTDWRLPSINQSSFGFDQYSGELGHMFYNNLGNQSNSNQINTSSVDGSGNIVFIENLVTAGSFYWYSDVREDNQDKHWVFGMHNGQQGTLNNTSTLFAWAVHDGDIATSSDLTAVPVPASAFLFGSALLGLMVTRRQAKS